MEMQVKTYPPLVSVTVAQEIIGGRSRGTIYKLLDEDLIASVKDGVRRLIVTESVFEYIRSLQTK